MNSANHGHGHRHGTRSTDPERNQCRRRNELHQLDAYRCALQLYRAVGRIVAQFPRGESDLRNQMRRASCSVPFNMGEGVGKRGKARAAAYAIALGETKELIVALDCVEIDELAPLDDIICQWVRLLSTRSETDGSLCSAHAELLMDAEPLSLSSSNLTRSGLRFSQRISYRAV